jgi:hypothetical protein
VRLRTAKASATGVIHEPTSQTAWAQKSSRKFRSPSGAREVRVGPSLVPASSASASTGAGKPHATCALPPMCAAPVGPIVDAGIDQRLA